MPEHLLGPHVVGQRVVIRRLVRGQTGPTGGPAFTDALGICTAWGDGTMTLLPDAGRPSDTGPLVIAIADIVSGKPVPPRPSHLTRVSARDAELRGLALVEGAETVDLGEWVLRASPAPDLGGRLLKRANSCLAMGEPAGDSVARALDQVEAFYAERGRPAMVQVEQGSAIESQVRSAGWEPLGRGDAAFLAAPVSRLHRLVSRLAALAPQPPVGEARGALATSLETTQPRITVEHEHARGSALLDADWLCLQGLHVEAEHRRRGLATAVLSALVEWGAERGARTAWLHVETDNAAALALYTRLGFSEHHRARYLVPSAPSAS